MTHFDNLIKIGINMDLGKKNIKLPKNWNKLTQSKYTNEDNFAILTGKINNLIVIDLDKKNDDFIGLRWFEDNFNKIDLINTLVTKTLNNGFHIYFKYNDKVKNVLNLNNLFVDILSDDKCCYQGKNYDIINNNSIRELTEQELELILKKDKLKQVIKKDNESIIDKNIIRELIMGLNKSRADNYEDWMKIGFYLSSVDNGEEIFEQFSKQSDKFDIETHKNFWNGFDSGEKLITIGTILDWLKVDNIKLCNKFFENKNIIQELDETSKEYGYSLKHNQIVKRNKREIQASHKNSLKCIEDEHNKKYKNCKNIDLYTSVLNKGFLIECNNCGFKYPETPIEITRMLAPTIYNSLIINVNEDINNKDTTPVVKLIKEKFENRIIHNNGIWYLYNNSNGIYEKKAEELIREEIDELVINMKENDENNEEWFKWMQKFGYKDIIFKEFRIKCYNEEKLDDREYLLGFENGVLDLENNIFRNGLKDEYITMKCNMKYDENYDTKLAENVLKTTFIIDEERNYALNRFSLCLEGFNNDQTMTFNYGYSASNGKSFLMERLKNSFGDYGEIFPVNFLTSKMKNAGDSNSTLINFKNKRFMFCSEPEYGCKLNINAIKTLTGDIVKARGLYEKNEIEIKPSYHMFMCCNVLPTLDAEDEGIVRRIKILEYNTRFVETPKKKGECKIIKYSRNEMKIIETGLMHLLIKNYFKLKTYKFIYNEPLKLTTIKNIYLNEYKDEINDLLLENYEICDRIDEVSFVKMKDIKDLLKSNNIKEKDTLTLKYMVENLFNKNVEFVSRKEINNKNLKSIFLNLSQK